MQKFECTGCGGTLKESGRFFICENCGTKYVLGRDEEGNPFTYQAIEKKEVAHGEMAKKATTIAARTISVREIRLSETISADVHREAISIETQDNIRVIESFLKAKEWDAAQRQINQLLVEDHLCAEAQWLGLMCERKVSTDRDLLNSFSNISESELIRLDTMLSNASPEFARRVVDLLFGGAYANDSMCASILALVLPYAKNTLVYSEKECAGKVSKAFETVIQKSFCRAFDYLLSAALLPTEVDRYIDYLERFADNTMPKTAQKYYARILEVDPGNIGVHRKLVKADIATDEPVEKCVFDFENLLKYSEDTDGETYGVIAAISSYVPSTVSRSSFMWNILGYHSKAPSGLKTEILNYAKILLKSSLWEQARNYLNLVLSFDAQSADAYWGLCLARMQAKDEAALSSKRDNLIDCPEFTKSLSLYQRAGNTKRAEELMSYIKKQKETKKLKKLIICASVALVALIAIIFVISRISYARKYSEKNIVITVLDKGYTTDRSSYSDGIITAFQLGIQNKSSLDILAFSGNLEIINRDGRVIDSSTVSYSGELKSGSSDEVIMSLDRRNSSDARELFETDLGDLKITFQLTDVTYQGYQKKEYSNASVVVISDYSRVQADNSSPEASNNDEASDPRQTAYNDAVSLLTNGKYEEAYSAFEQLGDYKDSASKMQEAASKIEERNGQYQSAVDLYNSGKYAEALEAFKKLGGYSDSNDYITKCQEQIKEEEYSAAMALYSSGKYEDARIAFAALGDFKDSKEMLASCDEKLTDQQYEAAISLFNQNKFEEAKAAFDALGDYKDSSEWVAKCDAGIVEEQYQTALGYYNSGNYTDAIALFNTLNGYKDSDSYITAASIMGAEIGGTIYLGSYEQDNDEANGSERIEWIVLDKQDGKMLVISKYILDWKEFSDSYVSYGWKALAWESSSVRGWLNDEFYNTAFSDNDKGWISLTEVTPDEKTDDFHSAGKPTTDHLFLLGMEEYSLYCTSRDVSATVRTDYVLGKTDPLFSSDRWWLRYRDVRYDSCISQVDGSGQLARAQGGESAGIRPVMWIAIP